MNTFSFEIKTNIFNNWNCIGIINNIDFSKPYKINIGDLPLVVWKNPNENKFATTINICKHMGSKLDNGDITNDGCLKCKYHGLENTFEERFGETIEYQGKLFWSYNSSYPKPLSLPFFNNNKFQKSYLEIDMDCSLKDSAYNSMDLRHPEYVHGGLFGFGNNIPPKNIKHYKFKYLSKLNYYKIKHLRLTLDEKDDLKFIRNILQISKNIFISLNEIKSLIKKKLSLLSINSHVQQNK
jgi:phenylpropionate dioxygenase-like ring-hydroxylating dioxygenase large terminal subunit